MKIFIKLTVVLIFLFSVSISAQKTTWLSADLKETNQSSSVYYSVTSDDEKEVNYFFKSGNVYRKLKYSNRKLVGAFFEFYETGELRRNGKYKNGLEEGSWKTYYKNGEIKEKGKYKNGKKIGIWKTFYKSF